MGCVVSRDCEAVLMWDSGNHFKDQGVGDRNVTNRKEDEILELHKFNLLREGCTAHHLCVLW